jgi:hypothetical protein
MPDETYQRLDLVTINGDSFVSNIDGNRERPSRTAGDWTLSAARGNGGGGGVTSMTDLVPVPSNGQLLIGNGSAFVNSTLTAGTGISISNGAGSITINATDGNITLDDGTAAAPSLNYTNYPTTGLYSSAANAIGFATSGVARAAISSTGLAVTGTITPTGSVHAAAGSVGNPSLAFNADQDTGLFNIGANNLGVAIGGAKVLDVASTGLGVTGTVRAPPGAAGGGATAGAGGLAFPATAVAVADANTLDDYEEGSWTPTDNSGAALSFTVYNATYTKIGRVVEVEAAIYFPSTASTAGVQIAGLPFTSAGGDDGTGGISFSATNVNLSFTGLILRGNTNFVLELISGASVTNLNMSSKYIKFFGWYHV